MLKDKRKATRREMRYSAWVALDNDQPLECAMADVSESGARLDIANAEQVPDQFILLLSRRGTPKRKCRVVWRNANQLGVEFERRLAQPQPFRRSKPEAPAEAQPAETPATEPAE